jgi:hypothetical protein
MTDCNGATIGVGDVVEVVGVRWFGGGSIKVSELDAVYWVEEVHGQLASVYWWHSDRGVGGSWWCAGSQLRLVRRKEKA